MWGSSSPTTLQSMPENAKNSEDQNHIQTFFESSQNEHSSFFQRSGEVPSWSVPTIQQGPMNLVSNSLKLVFKLFFLFSTIFIETYSNLEFFLTSNYGGVIVIDLFSYKE